jgi:hypothetical protein
VSDTLEDRVSLVTKDTQLLPKLPPAIVQAITDGKETITAAVAGGFDNYQAAAVAVDYSVRLPFLDCMRCEKG